MIHTKDELQNMSIAELQAIAQSLNTPHADSTEDQLLIDEILGKQSTDSATPSRRKRISVKDTSRVYSARLGKTTQEVSISAQATSSASDIVQNSATTTSDSKQPVADETAPEAPRKKRGRPSKADLEARKVYEEQIQRLNTEISDNTPQDTAGELSAATSDPDNHLTQPDMENTAASALSEQLANADTVVQTPETVDSDLPPFILAQMQHSPDSTSDNASAPKDEETSLAAFLERGQEKSRRELEKSAVKSQTPLPQEIIDAQKRGERFVIIKDVPPTLGSDFSFDTYGSYNNDENLGYSQSYEDTTQLNAGADSSVGFSHKDESLSNLLLSSGEVLQSDNFLVEANGVLEIDAQGGGFLRSADYNYMPSPDDVFVSPAQIRQFSLKMGDLVDAKARIPQTSEKFFTLVDVVRINGHTPEAVRDRIPFEHLTPLFPDEQFKLAQHRDAPMSCRIVDLFSPIGKGQRALIVAQPKTGKTILMKQIANAIARNYPDTYLMMLLIDERPEEVTDMARTVNAEVIASTFDESAQHHVRIAQIVLEKAKRMVECGQDVVIFLDSITRLARAFNTVAPTSGKILTGGVDAHALQKPKRFFGAARNIEGGGSLTIIATALIDTGSKMDEVIFEEFKGTGNMELQLDRNLSNKRIFPAVNLIQSSTRRDDLLLDKDTLNRIYVLRNCMADMSSTEAMDFVRKRLENSLSNEEFLATMSK